MGAGVQYEPHTLRGGRLGDELPNALIKRAVDYGIGTGGNNATFVFCVKAICEEQPAHRN